MRSFAYVILLTIVSMIIIQPLAEVVELCRENLVIGSAMTNSFRVARDRSLKYEFQRDMDAEVEIDEFSEYFAETFSDILDLSSGSISYGRIEFSSYNDVFNDFVVDIDLDEYKDAGGDTITTAEISVSTDYKFKNKFLKLITHTYELTPQRKYILFIKN